MDKNRIDANTYIDQNNEKVYTVDHVKLEILSQEPTTVDLDPEVKKIVGFLSTDVQNYV
jgi:hypothetical protein